MKTFESWGIRRRIMKEYNYNALWYDLKTVRLGTGVAKELPPDRAEFYDVGINTKCNTNCPWCFTAGTLVKTEYGNKPIEQIKLGDLVYSYNFQTKSSELKPVDQLHHSVTEEVISIELESGKIIETTPNHKFFTKNRGWVEAKDLTEDDNLLEYD
jgi:intein/homing endonuclease